MNNYIVTLPPPCTNSDLHMGHLTGVYILGDIYAKHQALNGHKTHHLWRRSK
ncbi:MAG: tRNA synthetase class [Burkholderiales bacterium]|jgi:methionyl-tRNA synthetase|nr:tRNA synthetase class [Burkholderiales bacterium]